MIVLTVFTHTIGGAEGTQPAGILTLQKYCVAFDGVHGYIVHIGNAQFIERLSAGRTDIFMPIQDMDSFAALAIVHVHHIEIPLFV